MLKYKCGNEVMLGDIITFSSMAMGNTYNVKVTDIRTILYSNGTSKTKVFGEDVGSSKPWLLSGRVNGEIDYIKWTLKSRFQQKPQQNVGFCTKCGMPNEYQSGPFVCFSCRNS